MFRRSSETLYAHLLALFAGQMVISCILEVRKHNLLSSLAVVASTLPLRRDDKFAVSPILSADLARIY